MQTLCSTESTGLNMAFKVDLISLNQVYPKTIPRATRRSPLTSRIIQFSVHKSSFSTCAHIFQTHSQHKCKIWAWLKEKKGKKHKLLQIFIKAKLHFTYICTKNPFGLHFFLPLFLTFFLFPSSTHTNKQTKHTLAGRECADSAKCCFSIRAFTISIREFLSVLNCTSDW